MQLPNKLYSYQESTLAEIPTVMAALDNGNVPVIDLYLQVRSKLNDPTDFLSVMDCLYALGAIDINEDEEVYKCY